MVQKQLDNLSISERLSAPTPSFFKKLKMIGLALAAISATIVAAPITLPTIVVTVAGYLAVAGSVMGAVSQVAVES